MFVRPRRNRSPRCCTACGGGPTANHVAASARPTSSGPTKAQRCVSEVLFWTPKVIARDPSATYGDYQDLGLTAAEYDVLRRTLAVTKRAAHAGSTSPTTATTARRLCSQIPNASQFSGYGWPPS
jgi:hypothetical protein